MILIGEGDVEGEDEGDEEGDVYNMIALKNWINQAEEGSGDEDDEGDEDLDYDSDEDDEGHFKLFFRIYFLNRI